MPKIHIPVSEETKRVEQLEKEREELLQTVKAITRVLSREKIRADQIEEEDLKDLVAAYPKYEIGKAYKLGDIFNYWDKLYEVLQAHTSQADWKPDVTGSLYVSRMPEG